jgi:hypothetical protein
MPHFPARCHDVVQLAGRTGLVVSPDNPLKKHRGHQIVVRLREADVEMGIGLTVPEVLHANPG